MFTFAAPAAAWLFALLAPLALFYFLKLRRPRQEISSLTLWRQVLNDRRVNSPFQRFKRNLLLLLQMLLLALLVLAATQPVWRRSPSRAHRRPVLIDCSASMAALDRAGGRPRLDEAKRQAREIIDGLLPGQEVCLISFSQGAHKLTGFTDDKRALRAALDGVEIEDIAGGIEDALRLTQALARATPFEEAVVLSDGNIPAQNNFDLSFKINYQRLPAGGPNLGIVSCNARRTPAEGKWTVFVEVAGSANAADGASVELSRDGTVIGSEHVTATAPTAAGGKPGARLSFAVEGDQAAVLRVRLAPDGFDSLGADNDVYLRLPAVRPLAVYASPGLAAWRHALRGLAGIQVFPPLDNNNSAAGSASGPPPAGYDLAIAAKPEDVPPGARVVCTVGFLPPELEKFVVVEDKSSGVVDWRRDAPLLQHVELTDLLLSEQPDLQPGITDGDFSNAGYETLIQGTRGPLLLSRRGEDGRLSVHWLFHPDRSTLPYRVGFPIFVANLAQAAMKEIGLSESDALHTGALPPLAVNAAERDCEVLGPRGLRQLARSDARGTLTGVSAPRAGEYRVLDGGAERARAGVALLSVSETGLDGVDLIRFSEQLSVAAETTALRTDQPIWFPLALAAFGLLLVEWWFYQRRPAAPAAFVSR